MKYCVQMWSCLLLFVCYCADVYQVDVFLCWCVGYFVYRMSTMFTSTDLFSVYPCNFSVIREYAVYIYLCILYNS